MTRLAVIFLAVLVLGAAPFVDTTGVSTTWATVCEIGGGDKGHVYFGVGNSGSNALTDCRVQSWIGPGATDVAASGVLDLTGLPIDTQTVVLGTKTYIFQDTLTDVDGNVKIGADADESLDNLIAAITLGSGAGTAYAASMTLHPDVTASAGTGDTMDVTAKVVGIGGNSLASTETLTNGSFTNGALLTGGTDVWSTVDGSWTDCASLAAGASSTWSVAGSAYVRLRVQVKSTSGTSVHCRQNSVR